MKKEKLFRVSFVLLLAVFLIGSVSALTDCVSDWTCIANNARTCTPASLTNFSNVEMEFFGETIVVLTNSYFEVKGYNTYNGKQDCIIYSKENSTYYLKDNPSQESNIFSYEIHAFNNTNYAFNFFDATNEMLETGSASGGASCNLLTSFCSEYGGSGSNEWKGYKISYSEEDSFPASFNYNTALAELIDNIYNSTATLTDTTESSISQNAIYALIPTTTYTGYSQKFKVYIDKNKLNIGNPVNYTLKFNIINITSNISLCGISSGNTTSYCTLREGETILKNGINFSIIGIDSNGARIGIQEDWTNNILNEGESEIMSEYKLNISVIKIETSWKNEIVPKSYSWDFGNGDIRQTTLSEINYLYNKTGQYVLKVNMTDSKNINYTRSFNINVQSPSTFVNTLLDKDSATITSLINQIKNNFSTDSDIILKAIGVSSLESSLNSLKADKTKAVSESDYINLMQKILALNIPEKIAITGNLDNAPYLVDPNKIDASSLESLAGVDYSSSEREQYIEQIAGWNNQNVELTLNYDEISTITKNTVVKKANVYKLNARIISSEGGSNSLLIKNLGNMNFVSEPAKQGAYYSIPISNNFVSIQFSTPPEIGFESISAFIISEDMKDFQVYDLGSGITRAETGEVWGMSKWVAFTILFILLIAIAGVGYGIMLWWYKHKYENHLFKNRNDLYNLVNFVKTSKNSGISNSDIKDKLKKSGWTGEQIAYVTRKLK